MNNQIFVTKRDGKKELLDLEKIHKVLNWAVDGVTGVSVSMIELRANIQLYDGIPAYDIHEMLINSAAELICEDTPNYTQIAARLINYKLRKEVYGQYEPALLLHTVEENIRLGVYDAEILDLYNADEWAKAEQYIKHERDDNILYDGMAQFRRKYLVQNRATGQYF